MKNKAERKTPKIPDGYGNLSDLARRLGVSRGRIVQLSKQGVLGETAHPLKNGRYLVDIEAAVQKLRECTDPVNHGHRNKIAGLIDPPPETSPVQKTVEISEMTFNSARTLKERYNAEMKKLDYEERARKLLRDEDVQKGAFEMYRKTRDSLINIVDRISAQLAAEKKEVNIRIILETEIRNALTHIRGSFDD
jgi:hypothetical protein